MPVAWSEQVESPGQVQHILSGVWEHKMVLETPERDYTLASAVPVIGLVLGKWEG